MATGRTRNARRRLAVVEAELGQFAATIRSTSSPRPLMSAEGVRLMSSMLSVVGACHAIAPSAAARRIAAEHGAIDTYERLVAAVREGTSQRRSSGQTAVAAGDALEVEAEVMRCYDATRPVLIAAAQLVRRLGTSDSERQWAPP